MKRHLSAVILGGVASAVGSAILALGSSLTAGYLQHRLEAWPWLFAVSILPCTLLPLCVLLFAPQITRNRMAYFTSALLLAFFATVFSASLGAIVVEATGRGLTRVNVSGYFLWCWIYGIVLLPISYPMALLVLRFSMKTTNNI